MRWIKNAPCLAEVLNIPLACMSLYKLYEEGYVLKIKSPFSQLFCICVLRISFTFRQIFCSQIINFCGYSAKKKCMNKFTQLSKLFDDKSFWNCHFKSVKQLNGIFQTKIRDTLGYEIDWVKENGTVGSETIYSFCITCFIEDFYMNIAGSWLFGYAAAQLGVNNHI